MNWNLFETIYDGVMNPVLTAAQAMMGPVSNAMQPIALIGVSIWLVFAFWDLAAHAKTLPMIGKEAFRVVMFYSLVWIGPYTQYVSNLFLNILPNSIGAILGGTGTPIGRLDALLGQAVSQASTVYEALPGYSLKGAILSVGVILFVVVAMICVAFIFIVLCLAGLINVLALVVGPIFLTLATMPFTRRFAFGWLSVLVGGVVTQLLALAVIQLLVGSSTTMLAQLAATAQATNSNSIMMLYGLGKIGILLWLFKDVVKKVPDLAQTIGGGVYHGTAAAYSAFTAGSVMTAITAGAVAGGVGGMARGAMSTGTASGGVLGAASGAAGGAARAAARGFRYSAPAGRSLSRRN